MKIIKGILFVKVGDRVRLLQEKHGQPRYGTVVGYHGKKILMTIPNSWELVELADAFLYHSKLIFTSQQKALRAK